MARSKSGRSRVARHNPIALTDTPTRHTGPKKAMVLPLISKLSAADEKERSEAAAVIGAMLLQDPETRKLLIKNNVLPLLVERLSDSSQSVRVESSGALRNLVFDDSEGVAVCESLHQLNILSLLEIAMRELILSLAKTTPKLDLSDISVKYDLHYAENLTAISLALCETSDEILKAVNNTVPSLAQFLFAVLHLGSTSPDSMQILAGQCLMSYTDDNKFAIDAICQNESYISLLLQAVDSADVYMAALSSGVLQNLSLSFTNNITLQVPSERVTSIALQTFKKALSSVSFAELGTLGEDGQNSTLSMIETSLECLAKLATARNGNYDNDMMETDQSFPDGPDSLNILLATIQNEFLPLLIALASPVEVKQEESYPTKLQTTHLLALDCLHNLAWTFVEVQGNLSNSWKEKAPKVWSWCIQSLPKFLLINDDIADSSMSLLYALAKVTEGRVVVSNEDISSFIKLYHSSLNAELQSKIVGLLGCLASAQGQIDHNKSIGTFLITTVASLPRTDADAAIEALNAIFDIYADAAFDYDRPVFIQCNFLGHLQSALPKVKAMKRTINRRTHGELWARADEAVDNLNGFIDYKKNEQS